jgi:exoribonuclease R
MNGIVELHGGSIMFSHGEIKEKMYSTDFIAGDHVQKNQQNNTYKLLYRTPQSAIAIVTNQKLNLYMPTLAPFSPKLDHNYEPGTRLVLWLNNNGTIIINSAYTKSATDDAPVINSAYCLTNIQEQQPLINHTYLYTREECVNHDDLDTFTIDPANSKDFDDAISVDKDTLYIHIVDIAAAYSRFSPEVISNLRNRCFTMYLENEHTEHLLDSDDSTTTLSLVKGVQRKVITVKATLKDGLVTDYEIYRSTIIVKTRYNYDEVQQLLNRDQDQDQDQDQNKALKFLASLSQERSKMVAYNINLPSLRITMDTTTGEPVTLIAESTNDAAHSIVATAMVLGNLIVSKHIAASNIPLPNRFHDTLRGFTIPEYEKTYNDYVDSFILVKRYARACYSVDKKGHFGLGITDYVHFTSPMRRYADVIVHLLLAGIHVSDLTTEVNHINQSSTLNRGLQDLYKKWKVVRWMKNSKKTVYDAWITGVSPAGALYYIPEISQNGFTHVSELEPPQRYLVNNTVLQGQTHCFKIGQKVEARIKSIDMDIFAVKITLRSTQH